MDYTKVMFGCNAVHLPFHGVVQAADGNVSLMLFATPLKNIRFGSKMTHQFVMGDMIIRPHVVYESQHLVGMGAAGIITSPSFCNLGEWEDNGNKLIDIKS